LLLLALSLGREPYAFGTDVDADTWLVVQRSSFGPAELISAVDMFWAIDTLSIIKVKRGWYETFGFIF
jgi:hypothetical protein